MGCIVFIGRLVFALGGAGALLGSWYMFKDGKLAGGIAAAIISAGLLVVAVKVK